MKLLQKSWKLTAATCCAMGFVFAQGALLWKLAPESDTFLMHATDELASEGVDYDTIVATVRQKSAAVSDEFHSTSTEVIAKSAKIFNADSTMREALRVARDTLPKFNSAFANHRKGRFSIRAIFSSHDKQEALWVRLVGLKGEDYYGELLDEPKHLKELEVGQPVHLKREDVVDWLIQQNDVLYGAYTTRVSLSRLNLPRAQKALEAIRDL